MLSAEQLETRKGGIGGSDIAAVMGFSPYKTALELYNEKLDLVEPEDLSDNDAVEWGNRLEDVVADKFADDTGLKVRRSNIHMVHQRYPFMMANIDRSVTGKPMGIKCGLECKTAGTFAVSRGRSHMGPDDELWGPGAKIAKDPKGNIQILEHDDHVPPWYLMQCAHYMAVTNSDFWFLSVLIGGRDFRTYTIRRDLEMEAMMLRRAANFWTNHVLKQVPPPPTTVTDMEALYPSDNGKAVLADPELMQACAEAKALRAEIKERETHMDELKDQIRMGIGEYSELLLNDEDRVIATWKGRKVADLFDKKRFSEDHPELYQQYTKTGRTSRVLLLK